MAKRWVYCFGAVTDGQPERKDVLGGKGAGLAAMCKAKLPVPPGFTISTECCQLFLDSGGQWPEGLLEEVRQNLLDLQRQTGRTFGDPRRPLLVSVRSGAAVSMPGMMDTILNCGLSPAMADTLGDAAGFWRVYAQFILMFGKTVAGIGMDEFEAARARLAPHHHGHGASEAEHTARQQEALARQYQQLYEAKAGKPFPAKPWETLVQCIETVFRSWNTPRAITYRQEHDVRGLLGTAVNVQAMFPSQVSGIVFTANPNDFAADEMIIESSYGLGEAVVSGDVHPDNFVLDRKSLVIKRRTIGHKLHAVSALGDTASREPDQPSLNDPQIAELASMCGHVESFFGKPMDIEWGLADGKFALLQARPIRGLEIIEDVEVGRHEEIHRLRELAEESKHGPGKARKVWVMHNLAETLAQPTPLTWDIIRGFMSGQGGFGRMYQDLGYRPSAQVRQEGFLELICGRIYADPQRAADLFWDGMPLAYNLDELARNPKLIESAPGKFQPEKANGRFLLSLPGLLRSMWRSGKLMKQARRMAVERFERQILPPYLEWVSAKRGQDLSVLGVKQLLEELDARIQCVLNDFGGESLKPGFFGGMAQAALEARLTQLMGRELGNQLCMVLTQGLEGDTTVQQNVWLYDVAKGRRRLEEFIDSFGHRAVGEMELSRPRWREDSSYVRQILGAYLDEQAVSPETRHDENAQRRQEAQRQLPATLAQWGGSSFLEDIQADLADAQAMLPYREAGKHYLMMGYETIRRVILELARRWDLGREIFFLDLKEMRAFAAEGAKFKDRIAGRNIRWQSARRLDMPEMIDSADLENLGLPRQYTAATELAGAAIASGLSTGVAQIVYDPSSAADLCSDYILVCPSTDPGWTALFVHARGLIVEQGGMLSHGAIVARDFGIPAVVCPDATRRIPHGATIRVDGNKGLITII